MVKSEIMNKQRVQIIVESYNKARNTYNEIVRLAHVYIIIRTDHIKYHCYEEVTLQDNTITFFDDYDDKIVLNYNAIENIKVSVE